MMNKEQYLQIDLYNGKSKWISKKDFLLFTVGDGTEEADYNWKDNWEYIRKTPTHTTYKGEECILVDFTNTKLA